MSGILEPKFNEFFQSSDGSKNTRTDPDGSDDNRTDSIDSTSTTPSDNSNRNSTPIDSTTNPIKTIVLQLACETNMGPCENLAMKLLSQMNATQNSIPVDQRQTIYCTAIRLGTEADWVELRKLYKSSQVAGERSMILKALCCSRDSWALEKMIRWAFTGANMNKDDVLGIFSTVVRNPVGYQLAKNYLIENIYSIKKL